jgi:hypothetical protein
MAHFSRNDNLLVDGRLTVDNCMAHEAGQLDMLSSWSIIKSEVPLLGRRGYIKAYTRVPYKVYNSVPVVLYLKQFRMTGCTYSD